MDDLSVTADTCAGVQKLKRWWKHLLTQRERTETTVQAASAAANHNMLTFYFGDDVCDK